MTALIFLIFWDKTPNLNTSGPLRGKNVLVRDLFWLSYEIMTDYELFNTMTKNGML